MQPLGWNSGRKSSVRGKGDRGTEGNLSTLLTFLPPPKWAEVPARQEGEGPRKSGGDQSSQVPCTRQGTVVLL